jgi:hypothetical protein
MNALLRGLRVVGLLLMLPVVGGTLPQSDAAASSRPTVAAKLMADLACRSSGGADVTFTIQNRGRDALHIDGDIHLTLEVRRSGEPPSGTAVFVFPAPGFDVIPVGESRTFLIPMGDAIPEAEIPGTDLSGIRLRLEAEVWFAGRDRPVRRDFAFPACPPPA